MRRPVRGEAKAAALGRMLVSAGVLGVDVERTRARVYTNDLAIAVYGKSMPHHHTVGMVLAQLRDTGPYRSSVVVRCVEPEMEGAHVTLRLDDFLRIYCKEE